MFEVRPGGEVRVYTGNWSDYDQKRREEDVPLRIEKEKPIQPRVKEKKLKFTYKEEREFSTIEEDIAALEQAIEENQAAQEAAGSDYGALQTLQDERSQLEEQLAFKEERWLYLTELKERIDAQ